MIQITTNIGTFGPFNSIIELEDRYDCDGAHYPFTVIGKGVIEEYVAPPEVQPEEQINALE